MRLPYIALPSYFDFTTGFMTQTKSSAVIQLLQEVEAGNIQAFNQLYHLVYGELKRMAAQQRARWDGDFTINTTALVHEAYEKMVKSPGKAWDDRRHFYSVAAKAMRQILYTYAERSQAKKRGGDVKKVSLEDEAQIFDGVFNFSESRILDVLAMEEAMKKLEEISPREANIVEYRFYLGMSVEETAKMLNIGSATVKRGWVMAKAWLYSEIQ